MTPVEIAYFKHFMYDKQLERSFIYYYRKNHVKGSPRGDKDGNPESIEQYLLQTSVKDVIMKAFTFYLAGNAQRANATFDYWKNVDDQWQDYIKTMSSNFSNESWPQLRKTFAILRQNWDALNYWRKENFESTEEVYKRMHSDLPLPEFRWNHGYTPKENRPDANLIKYDIHNAKDGDFVVRTRVLKNGSIGRTIFIIKEVVPYDPETSEFSLEELHRDYSPDKKNIHIAYLHARYNSMGEGFSHDYAGSVRAVIDDDLTTENYRLAFKEEEQTMILKLAEHQLAWNPATKTIVQLLDALKPRSEETTQIEHSVEEHDNLEIDFVEFSDNRRQVNALQRGIISVNKRNHSWRVTVNRTDTKEIKQKRVDYVRTGKLKSGEVVMQFCNTKDSRSIPITLNGDGYYNINSRQFTDNLLRMLSITDDLVYLSIEKISERLDSITYKVTQQ